MFKSGEQWNGNKNGRPKKFTIKDFLTPDDVAGLIKVAHKKAQEGNNDMIKFVLEHALGKAPQSIDHTTQGDKITPIFNGQSISKHESDTKDIQPEEEDKSSGGGDVSE